MSEMPINTHGRTPEQMKLEILLCDLSYVHKGAIIGLDPVRHYIVLSRLWDDMVGQHLLNKGDGYD